jgi:hypothetical protein
MTEISKRRDDMRRSVVAILTVTAIGLLGATQEFSLAGSKDDMCVPMGSIVLKAPAGAQPKRSAVTFPHARHFDVACATCHHTWGRTEPITGCMTSGCHDLAEPPKRKPGDEDAAALYFKNAFHTSCIGCHKQIKAKAIAQQKSLKTSGPPPIKFGPTSCGECHPK